MNRCLAAFGSALVLGILAGSGPSARAWIDDRHAPSRGKDSQQDNESAERISKVLKLHNAERARAKLHSLEVNPRLQKAAERHARDMAAHRKMSHIGSDDSKPLDRVKDAGYDYRRTGENIAFGRFTPDQLMEGWMESATHKRNILGSFSQIGVACATAEDGMTYWCVTFGLPMRN
jgi:uncharacterized protein YkwD